MSPLRDASVLMATLLGVSTPVVGTALAADDGTTTTTAAPSTPSDDSTTSSTTVPSPTASSPATSSTTTTTPTTTTAGATTAAPSTTVAPPAPSTTAATTTTTSTTTPAPRTAATTTTTPATTTTIAPAPVDAPPADTVPPSTAPPETVPPETVPPDTVPPETLPPETVPPDAVAAETASPSAPLPPMNPVWLQVGGARAQGVGVPGARLPEAGRTPAGARHVLVDDVGIILATIREVESGGRYDVGPNRALASGAYQYIPSTWNGYGGYAEAYLAPPEVQDERARGDVERFLATYQGDVSMIPVMWYFPLAASDPAWMDRVPNPAGGNRLTVREYQAKWLDLLARNATTLSGTYVPGPGTPAAVSVLSSLPGAQPQPLATEADPAAVPAVDAAAPAPFVDPFVVDAVTVSAATMDLATRSTPPAELPPHGEGAMRSIVFPVLGPVDYADTWGAPRDDGRRTHEGTDLIGVPMQPLLAAVDGVVTRVQYDAVGIAGVALSVQDADGWRYNYFHGNNDTPGTDDGASAEFFRIAPGITLGSEVRAGQIIGYMGDSGNSELSVAHLHFELRDPEGRAHPSFWALEAARARQACTVGIGPWSTPALADNADSDAIGRLVARTTVVPSTGLGEWVIDSDGRVTATGDAALIMPSAEVDCAPGPVMPFGTDAAGWDDVRPDVLDGTILAGVDLAGSQLTRIVPPEDPPADDTATAVTGPQIETVDDIPTEIVLDDTPLPSAKWRAENEKLAVATGVDIAALREPMAFTDPSTGETVLVVFDLGPSVAYTPTPPAAAPVG